MSHYDELREQDYAQQRKESNDRKQPVVNQAKALLSQMRISRFGDRATTKLEEVIFWMEKEIH